MAIKKNSFYYRNSLSIVFISLFLFALVGQALTGWQEHNSELEDEGRYPISLGAYLYTGHFITATFENFQSEFLQMALYVVLTVSLRQWGSAESKKLDEKEDVDREPRAHPDAPAPVKKGGWMLKLYSNSLSLAFFLLFFVSWIFHLNGSMQNYNEDQIMRGKAPAGLSEFLSEPVFWFETFQNWQSEFLSVASIVVLSIYLRQKGSPESKPVDAPHSETGK